MRQFPRSLTAACLAAALLVLLPGVIRSSAEEIIRVPFGFRWGDTPQMVEDAVTRAQARIVEKKTENGRDVLVAQGHPDKRLRASLFYFQSDALVEVELQYSDDTWDATKFGAVFDETRRALDRKYGQGRNIAKQRMQEGDVIQTVLGYQWTQQETTLRLFMYTAEKGAETFRMLSYHYRSS